MMSLAPRSIGVALTVRPAGRGGLGGPERLIAASARGLSEVSCSSAEVETLIAYVFGIDTELAEGRIHLMVEVKDEIVVCGGWSRRRTLFGGDQYLARSSDLLESAIDVARIRAFVVSPDLARRALLRVPRLRVGRARGLVAGWNFGAPRSYGKTFVENSSHW